MPDKTEFCEADVRTAYKVLKHKEETELRLINPKTGFVKTIIVSNMEDFVKVCRENNGLCNVYVGLNERQHGAVKMDKKAVKFLNAFCIDIDPNRVVCDADRALGITEDTKLTKEAATEEEVTSALMLADMVREFLTHNPSGNVLKPTISFMSGNGGQFWVSAPNPIPINDDNRDIVDSNLKLYGQKLAERFAEYKGASIDTSVFELARIAKVPGTVSVKGTGMAHRPFRLSKINHVEIDDTGNDFFFNLLTTPMEGVGKPMKSSEFTENYMLPKSIRNDIEKKFPKMLDEGQRHNAFVTLYGMLNSQGYAKEQIRDAVLWLNKLKCKVQKPEDQVEFEFNGIVATYKPKAEDKDAWSRGLQTYSEVPKPEVKFPGYALKKIDMLITVFRMAKATKPDFNMTLDQWVRENNPLSEEDRVLTEHFIMKVENEFKRAVQSPLYCEILNRITRVKKYRLGEDTYFEVTFDDKESIKISTKVLAVKKDFNIVYLSVMNSLPVSVTKTDFVEFVNELANKINTDEVVIENNMEGEIEALFNNFIQMGVPSEDRDEFKNNENVFFVEGDVFYVKSSAIRNLYVKNNMNLSMEKIRIHLNKFITEKSRTFRVNDSVFRCWVFKLDQFEGMSIRKIAVEDTVL